MRLALTGTPGVGKTTLASMVGEALSLPLIDVKVFALEHGFHDPFEESTQAYPLDLDAIADALPEDCLMEGHVAHLLDADAIIVLRVHPRVLKERLHARGYGEAKIQENLEAEAMDLILQESLDEVEDVLQLDATQASPEQLLARIEAWWPERGRQLDAYDAMDFLL